MSCILKEMIEKYVDDKIPQLQTEIKEVREAWNEEAEHLTNQLIEARNDYRSAKETKQLFEDQYLNVLDEKNKLAKEARWLKIGAAFSILGNIALIIVSLYLYF